MGTMIEFARPDGGRTKGYLATAGQGRPGVVVIQEWWGLNDQICGVADRFARAGYNALAPDLYKGRVTTEPDEANHLMTGLDFADATHQDLRGAAQHLQAQSGKVAVMGYCMGGALDHRCRRACPGIRRRRVLLRDPAQGVRRPGQDPCAAAGPFRQQGRLVHTGRGRRSRKGAESGRRQARDLPLRRGARFRQRAQRRLRRRLRQPGLGAHGGIPGGANSLGSRESRRARF